MMQLRFVAAQESEKGLNSMNGWKYKTPLLVAIALLLFACISPTPAPVPDTPLSGTALAAARTRVPERKALATQQAKQTGQAMAGLTSAKGSETPGASAPAQQWLRQATRPLHNRRTLMLQSQPPAQRSRH